MGFYIIGTRGIFLAITGGIEDVLFNTLQELKGIRNEIKFIYFLKSAAYAVLFVY